MYSTRILIATVVIGLSASCIKPRKMPTASTPVSNETARKSAAHEFFNSGHGIPIYDDYPDALKMLGAPTRKAIETISGPYGNHEDGSLFYPGLIVSIAWEKIVRVGITTNDHPMRSGIKIGVTSRHNIIELFGPPATDDEIRNEYGDSKPSSGKMVYLFTDYGTSSVDFSFDKHDKLISVEWDYYID